MSRTIRNREMHPEEYYTSQGKPWKTRGDAYMTRSNWVLKELTRKSNRVNTRRILTKIKKNEINFYDVMFEPYNTCANSVFFF